MTFLGFIALEDSIRTDVVSAIQKTKEMGVRTLMVTGDHPETARAVAYRVGILPRKNSRIVQGTELAASTDDEVRRMLQRETVFARVLPQQKKRIARLLKGEGEIVAMTGDGINDALALQAAHVGIAVGSGTDVAKAAADLILLRDSFALIVTGIEEGRRVLDNIKKITAYLLSGSFVEVFLIGAALVARLPLPLLPAQLLWHNIISEGLMSFPFAYEKREVHANRRAAGIDRGNLSRPMIRWIAFSAFVGGINIFLLFIASFIVLRTPLDEVRTILFVALTLMTLLAAFVFRQFSPITSFYSIFRGNRFLVAAVLISFLVLVAVFVIPPLPLLLSLMPFSIRDIFIVTIFVGIYILALEWGKRFFLLRQQAS